MITGRIGRIVSKCNDKSNGRVGLRLIHESCSMGIPVIPGATEWFRVGNKANIAIVEVIPVFPAATDCR